MFQWGPPTSAEPRSRYRIPSTVYSDQVGVFNRPREERREARRLVGVIAVEQAREEADPEALGYWQPIATTTSRLCVSLTAGNPPRVPCGPSD
jgi:hypothetical protein